MEIYITYAYARDRVLHTRIQWTERWRRQRGHGVKGLPLPRPPGAKTQRPIESPHASSLKEMPHLPLSAPCQDTVIRVIAIQAL